MNDRNTKNIFIIAGDFNFLFFAWFITVPRAAWHG